MACSASQWTSLRPILISIVVVLCFLYTFLSYRSDIQYPHFGIDMSPYCPAFLCAENTQTNESNPDNSTELHNNPHSNQTQKIQAAAMDAERDTILLIWMWPFGFRFDLNCNDFNISRCHLTNDKNLYHKAHGILFHHRDINGQLSNMPKLPRPSFQKWVWFNMESPANSNLIPGLNQVFNLTCSYRLDSDIPVPYGYLEPVTSEDESFKLPAKDKLVCWIVSNWNPKYKRVEYYNELKKHVEIHIYGKAFGKKLSDQEYSDILLSCKFYLSFENSISRDYITEKLYNPMGKGSVPIALGPTRQMYEDHIPADSFIHVNDFSTPKELAQRLLYLDQNHSEYMRFFNWTSMFKVKGTHLGRDHACKTCKYLQNHRGYQAVNDLNGWYWG
ncbi:4-galactosyl-N-acetylglucosaminide 3-alpha-L-fucosyltransferase 9-like [Cyclopterus lumpus]|uniref:4-galactosyl-N-acetylglucosaminide 3-alpha-L-fucosyltransferase 9-like n=1 Tax=Cyclopterus lumpus TaxID=8103 RepID=UPI001486B49F|nr:4-galactosyl-N-acetylglucosaminide 3-alpha-L-fucosyltransferase 9-like [Cyclopterus lumpus]XP_034381696.1 4-galactosyl-N-acetylglucosaminide 3-alpha-L-fucosyltransferase 9-like [Cyclopterus lumpus]XP_034381697.1 4-galactosyl-N-acetylglucosaminide 3-alpha-L-fucosyltransferase 9-like [Cyclopterus lumpus]